MQYFFILHQNILATSLKWYVIIGNFFFDYLDHTGKPRPSVKWHQLTAIVEQIFVNRKDF